MIDQMLQMFISTCCAACTTLDCEGALNIKDRAICKKYAAWQLLAGDERARLFIEASTGKLITLERIKNRR